MLAQVFALLQGLLEIIILGFYESSIGVQFRLVMEDDVTPEVRSEMVSVLDTHLENNNGQLAEGWQRKGDISIIEYSDDGTPQTIAVTSPCDVYIATDTCKNGGTCELNLAGAPECICADGYTGQHCDITDDDTDSTRVLAITLGCIGGFLGLVAIIFVCVLCRQRMNERSRGRTRRYDREHGFDESSSEGSWQKNSVYNNWIKRWWFSPYDAGMMSKPMAPKVRPTSTGSLNYPRYPAQYATGQYNYGFQ